MQIHPTAIISSEAIIGEGTKVGPYAIIEGVCEIGQNCEIRAHAIIYGNVKMGDENVIHSGTVIGGEPQDISFDPQTETGVRIGSKNVFREGVTVNRATVEKKFTCIGSKNYIMNLCHFGHDVQVGDCCILATATNFGGHTQVGDAVVTSGGTYVHQFCRLGSMVMVGRKAAIAHDVIPYTMIVGDPPVHYRVNLVGLQRNGFSSEVIQAVSSCFRLLRKKETPPFPEKFLRFPEVQYLDRWMREKSKRGISGFLKRKKPGKFPQII